MMTFNGKSLKATKVFFLIALVTMILLRTSQGQQGRQAEHKSATLGLPSPTFPSGTPPRPEEVALGEELFREPALSLTRNVSCITCHIPSQAFTDHLEVSKGVYHREGTRNAPSLLNVAFVDKLSWDGAHATLEDQALIAISNSREMDLSLDQVSSRVEAGYGTRLRKVYGSSTPQSVAKALAAYERTLIAGDSPFDRFLYGGDKNAISESAKRGFKVSLREGRCVLCHTIRCDDCHPFGGKLAIFTDNRFHNLGIGFDKNADTHDWGRWHVTAAAPDRGAFKTPSLRNIELTAPYMHDGSLATLEDVIEHYNKGGIPNVNLDPDIRPLHLSQTQKNDLLEFLKSLTSVELKPSIPTNHAAVPEKTGAASAQIVNNKNR
jgi:cytochrome c peroxidase